MTKLKENIAAALDRHKLGAREHEALQRYALATRHQACDGCAQHCEPHAGGARVAHTLRYLMYHDAYGERDQARELFRSLPADVRRFADRDFSMASAACPNGLNLAQLMRRAEEVLG